MERAVRQAIAAAFSYRSKRVRTEMLARGWHGVGPGGANPLCKGVSTLPPAELHDVSTQLARQLARSRGGLELKAEGGSATQKQLEAIAAMEAPALTAVSLKGSTVRWRASKRGAFSEAGRCDAPRTLDIPAARRD
jgi:hypothetical protein